MATCEYRKFHLIPTNPVLRHTLHRTHVQCLHSTEPCRKYPKLPIRASIKIGRRNCSCHL